MKRVIALILIVGLIHESACDGDHGRAGFGQRRQGGGQRQQGGQQLPRQQRQRDFQQPQQQQQQQQQQQAFPSFPPEEQSAPFEDDEPVLSNANLPPPPQPPALQAFQSNQGRQGRQGRARPQGNRPQQQQGRLGRQFNADSADGSFSGSVPDENGNYNFQFQTDDGSSRRETGSVKSLGNEEANSITGEYSWTSPEGELVSFSYVADENGFQPQGSHIPQNVQPIHPALQRGLDLIARVNGNSK